MTQDTRAMSILHSETSPIPPVVPEISCMSWLDVVIAGMMDETLFVHEGKTITRRGYLVKVGYLSSLGLTAIETKCRTILAEYDAHGREPTEVGTSARADLMRLLIFSGKAQLITALDWSVDRIREACRAHGLLPDGFHRLENLLSRKYGTPGTPETHLHKGPGNGALPKYLAETRAQSEDAGVRDTPWREEGIADRLYFVLEDILAPFLRADIPDTSAMRTCLFLIHSVLKRELRKQWFTNESQATISTWRQTAPVCDMNDLYRALSSFAQSPMSFLVAPSGKSGSMYHSDTGMVRVSTDFEHDAYAVISP